MDEMREREKRVTLAWDGLCGCDGFIEIDGGWVGRKAPVGGGWRVGRGQGRRDQRWGGWTGTGSLFLLGLSGHPDAAQLRVPVQMTVRQR